MAIHKPKGKQFDAVIMVRESIRQGAREFRSSLVWRGDEAPYDRSRKILRVGITRAPLRSDARADISGMPHNVGAQIVRMTDCGRLLLVATGCFAAVGTNQRIGTTFLSRFSAIADIERLPVAAS